MLLPTSNIPRGKVPSSHHLRSLKQEVRVAGLAWLGIPGQSGDLPATPLREQCSSFWAPLSVCACFVIPVKAIPCWGSLLKWVYLVLIAKANKLIFRSFSRETRHSVSLTEAQFMQPQLLGSKFFWYPIPLWQEVSNTFEYRILIGPFLPLLVKSLFLNSKMGDRLVLVQAYVSQQVRTSAFSG